MNVFKTVKNITKGISLLTAAIVSFKREIKAGPIVLGKGQVMELDRGITLVVCDRAILATIFVPEFLPGAMALKNQIPFVNGKTGLPITTEYLVIINGWVANAPLEIMRAIINHEVGHIRLGHVDTMSSWGFLKKLAYIPRRLMGDTETLNWEYEADAYARSNRYDIRAALGVMVGVVGQHKELLDRISKLSETI